MRLYYCFILKILLIGSLKISAQSPWCMETRIDQELLSQSHFNRSSQVQNQYEFRSNFSSSLRFRTLWKMQLSGRVIYNTSNRQRHSAFLNESYLAINRSFFSLKAGKQITRWGDATGLSAMDLANTYDYYDYLDTEGQEIGSWGVDLSLAVSSSRLRMRFFPSYQRSRLYFENHNWTLLPDTYTLEQGGMNIIVPLQYDGVMTMGAKSIPTWGIDFSTEFLWLDWNISYLQGVNDVPLAALNMGGDMSSLPVSYRLGLYDRSIQISAISISRLIGGWNLLAEYAKISNQLLDELHQIKNYDYRIWSLSLDKTFLFNNPSQYLQLLVQYRRPQYSTVSDYGPMDLDHVLDHALILNLDWKLSYKYSLALLVASDVDTGSYIMRPSFDIKITDQFSMALGADLLTGSEEHFFGHYSLMDRFVIRSKLYLQ